MACNTLSLVTSCPPASVAAYAPLSSASAPFVASSAPVIPMISRLFSPTSPLQSLSVSCSLSGKEGPSKPMEKALLTGLVAVGAALSVFTADTVSSPTPAFAASGPGTNGPERTAQKAQDLLKAADKLNVKEAPQRFGPGTITRSNQDAGKIAQDAGAKTISQIQDGISSISGNTGGKKGQVQGVAENVARQAQSKIEDNSEPGGFFNSIKGSLQGVKESVAQKDAEAKKTLDEATSKVKSSIQ